MDDGDSNLSGPAHAAPPVAGFNFRSAFARQWRESVRYFGWPGALRELAGACWRALIELLPSRRKARFGDLDYDWEHAVDTTRSNVSFRTQLLAELAGRPYFASEPWLFEQIMQALTSTLSIQQSAVSHGVIGQAGLQDFTFVDLGSGKGRALLMAAQHGFRHITGVEFMPEWHRTAEENISKYAASCVAENRPAAMIESICMDARDFQFPAGPLVVYLFNPFPESTFVAVLENLRKSAEQAPRPVYIAYRFPEFAKLLAESGWLEKAAGTEQWAVYRNRRDRK